MNNEIDASPYKLLPCPFCGCEINMASDDDDHAADCYLSLQPLIDSCLPSALNSIIDASLVAWNRRALPVASQNFVLPHAAVTPMFLLNAAVCIESPHEVPTFRKREVLASLHRVADELQTLRMKSIHSQHLVSEKGKWMPADATEAMMHAAQDVPEPRPYGAVYRAMYTAAPAPQQEGSEAGNG